MEKNELKKYGYDEILKVIDRLSEEEKAPLLANLKVSEICALLNSPNHIDKYLLDTECHAYSLLSMVESMRKLNQMSRDVDYTAEDYLADYDKFSEETRKKVVLDLLNNHDFQRKCVDVIVKDYERVVKSDATVAAIDSLFGVSKYFRKCVETGLGCDHKYIIEEGVNE